jgi:hypothetical protein
LEAGSVPPSLNFPQLDFVKPSSGFHPVIWERVTNHKLYMIPCQNQYCQGEHIDLGPHLQGSLIIFLHKIGS